MRGFQSLILLQRQELNEKRRKLIELEARKNSFIDQKNALIATIDHEAHFAANNPEYAHTCSYFIHSVRQRMTTLDSSIAETDESIHAARIDVHTAYINMRKFELAREDQLTRLKKEQAYRETAELDELGLIVHRRQASNRWQKDS